MTRTVVALFDDFNSANNAVRELLDNGFTRDDMSVVASDASGDYSRNLNAPRDADTSGAAEGAGVGAGIGAVIGGLGGLLLGLGALTIPGIGPVIAAGPLSAALTGLAGAGVGAVAGGVTGGLLGALVDMGVPEETAQYYTEGVRRGGTLVTLRSPDEMTDRAVNIFNRHNPVDINKRATQWRESGWVGFDPNAAPYREESSGMSGGMASRDMNMADQSTHYDRAQSSLSEATYSDFTSYDDRFRGHFDTNLSNAGFNYDQYVPAYRYGYDLATDPRYNTYDWTRIEPEARRYWDERNPGTWDRFKLAVRHAWEEVKDKVD